MCLQYYTSVQNWWWQNTLKDHVLSYPIVGTTHLIRFSWRCLWLAVEGEVEAGWWIEMVGGEMSAKKFDDAEIGTQFQMCGCQ